MKKIALLVTILASGSVFADNFNFAYIDVGKIFTQSVPAQAMQKVLKDKFAPDQTQLQQLNQALVVDQGQLKSLQEKYPSLDKASATGRATIERVSKKYQQDQMAFQQKYSIFQQKMQHTQDYASALLLGKANTILKNISEKNGYDLVLSSNQLVYVKPKYDVTDEVLSQLNKIDTQALVRQLDNADKQNLSPEALKALAAPKG